jgi:tetratricopeptide (TPR) repeat protein
VRLALLLAVALSAGCDSYHYHAGRFDDVRRRPFAAIRHYEQFLADRPNDPRAVEIHVRAGEIYMDLRRCLEARRHFEAAARGWPNLQPWYDRAAGGIMACPDYFPLEEGRAWVYGDSASRGKNMRLDAQVRVSSGAAGGQVTSALYAGKKVIRTDRAEYKKSGWMVLQRSGADDWAPILRYPFRAGETWKAKRGRDSLVYTIVADDARVKTVAGVFTGCLKVKEFNPAIKGSWKYDYYAPFVGRVATTVGGPGFENPNTELIKTTP